MEDDLEEMKMLRARRNYRKPKSSDSDDSEEKKTESVENLRPKPLSPNVISDGESDIAATMGFSGFGKKARTFDFDALFEQTRRAAKENASQSNVKIHEESHTNSNDANYVSNSKVTETVKHSISTNVNEDSDSHDSSLIGPPLPPGFSSAHDKDDSDSSDSSLIGPPLPPGFSSANDKDDSSDDEEEEDFEEADKNRYSKIPASHEIRLEHGNKVLSAVSIDPSGARLVTGGYDFDVKFWDFSGMDATLQSFRTLRPCECHQIKNLEYSITGDSILIVSGNSQAKVLDRDGFEIFECPKGDQYITDMSKTKGHCGMLNDGCWHPREKGEFLTCSIDGSLRIWFAEDKAKQQNVIKPRQQGGLRAIPVSCRYSRNGQLVATACQDGSIQMWDHRKNFVSTTILMRTAHQKGTDISSLAFSYDGNYVASRGCDETLKLWDLRNFKQPVNTATNLFNRFPMTDCNFSPDDHYVFTGVSLERHEKTGRLVFLNRNSFKTEFEIEVSDCDVVRSFWHPKLNQIIASTRAGEVKMYYNPDLSDRGAKLCVVRSKSKTKQMEVVVEQQIITPHALPMFRVDRPKSTKKQMEKDRKDPLKSQRPDLPVTGPGQGGRLASAGSTLSSFIVRNLGLKKKVDDTTDPREAILKFAKDAAENPYWITPAYSQTQPKPIFQPGEEDEEQEEPSKKQMKFS